MAKETKSQAFMSKKAARNTKSAKSPDRPGGKLGLIVDRLATKQGVTADELAQVTGWQRHSVLGALSRLKSRGFDFALDVKGERKFYRITPPKRNKR